MRPYSCLCWPEILRLLLPKRFSAARIKSMKFKVYGSPSPVSDRADR